MKFILLALLTLAAVSCASHQDREPSSERNDVSHGVNHDYNYGTR